MNCGLRPPFLFCIFSTACLRSLTALSISSWVVSLPTDKRMARLATVSSMSKASRIGEGLQKKDNQLVNKFPWLQQFDFVCNQNSREVNVYGVIFAPFFPSLFHLQISYVSLPLIFAKACCVLVQENENEIYAQS